MGQACDHRLGKLSEKERNVDNHFPETGAGSDNATIGRRPGPFSPKSAKWRNVIPLALLGAHKTGADGVEIWTGGIPHFMIVEQED
jgi:hypothetical protein